MVHESLPRRIGKFLVVTTAAVGMTAGFASSASASDAPPTERKSCTAREVGDELITIKSASVTPVVTHFTSFYVTPGTLSSNTYRLNVVGRVSTSINGNTSINDSRSVTGTRFANGESGNSQALFDQVGRTVGFGVRTDEATTNTQDASVQWRFNSPGYYGLYKGTMQVSGAFTREVCDFGWRTLTYQLVDEGTYSTFGPVEEGTVGCSDALPAKTVRKIAQTMLGCGSTTPARTQPADAKASANAAPR
ncbi:hypothetical protein Aab01nite_74200 [Paractinoplanes abujensis]|uniref:Uncharacterized protein n=1 Tax=Paractinoplanes abujensis TaxID=882441 RepID=A0A7W7CUX4_9ACTN|nr:hypothetical protein [Actinoplanes abujensis]MBB4695098.1 hypothetical protein [Actinoplanes abujensis]GID23830.1 hypothetical protein Aab01nite_74200 [Actinoplanes abujensis]